MKDKSAIEAMQIVAVSDKITLYRPTHNPSVAPFNKEDGPDLIIVCAWFRALPKYTAKYLATYHDRYPQAQIVLLESNISDMQHTPYSTQRKRLLPIVELIKSLPQSSDHSDNKKKILLHIFSNGGSNSAVQLASAWQQTQSSPLPVSAIVLDSAPGSSSLKLAEKAITSSFPPQARWWVTIVVYLFVLPLVTLPYLLPGGEFLVDMCRARLHDPAFFPRGAPRVYFASPADELVLMRDVEAHCEGAREAGFEDARIVAFGGSGHVAHVREDGEMYWGAVWGVWGKGLHGGE